jgi:radical SAM superfamily enzyme YgiQ (UPF0313 family)
MRVLLVQPHVSPNYFGLSDRLAIIEPLSLEYLGAGIKNFCETKILDMRLDKELEKNIEEFNPDIIAVTGYAAHAKIMKEILKRAKKKKPEIVTIAGGIFVTSYPTYFTDNSFDILVIGEGVFPLIEIIQKLDQKKDLSTIAGVALPKDGKLNLTAPRPHPRLDTLPFPDRSLTSKYRNNYFMPIMKPVALLRTSMGCAFKCNFCLQHKLSGGRYLPREPELVVEELKQINEGNVTLADDETFLNIKRASHLADVIKQEGIKKRYHAFVRADSVVRHKDIIEKWIDIGLFRVLIGFESFKEDDLKYYNKKSSTSTNEKAINILNALDIDYTADFIIRPEYDENDFRQLRKYVRKLKIENPSFPVLTPYPGTALFEEVKDILLTDDLELYDQHHLVIPPKIPLKKFYSELARLRRTALPRTKRIQKSFQVLRKFSKDDLKNILVTRRKIKQIKKLA